MRALAPYPRNFCPDYGGGNVAPVLPSLCSPCPSSTQVALELIGGGASVDIPDLEGDTLLHRAIRTGNVPSATFLLKNGADINCRSDITSAQGF